jgi:hypothetical protein
VPSHHRHGATTEGLVGHQKNAMLDRELVKFVLRKVPVREVSHAVYWCNSVKSGGQYSRVYLNLVDGRDDASDLEDPLRLEDVEVGNTCSLRQRGWLPYKGKSACQ